MKINKMLALTWAVLGLTFISTLSTRAQGYLLTVDVSHPANVTFTATVNPASGSYISISSSETLNGVTLIGFFTGASNFKGFLNSGATLIGGNTGIAYFYGSSDKYYTSVSYVDFNLLAQQGAVSANFNTSTAAFTGSASVDFSSIASLLPSNGSGNIYAGYSGAPGAPIGQYQVIGATPTPEPGVNALLAVGALAGGVVLYRRRTATA